MSVVAIVISRAQMPKSKSTNPISVTVPMPDFLLCILLCAPPVTYVGSVEETSLPMPPDTREHGHMLAAPVVSQCLAVSEAICNTNFVVLNQSLL